MKKTYRLEGEVCANCAIKIGEEIERLDGVTSAKINAMTNKFKIEAEDDKLAGILDEAQRIINRHEDDCVIVR